MAIIDLVAAMQAALAENPERAEWTNAQWSAWFNENVTPTLRALTSRELLAWAAEGRIVKFDTVLDDRQHPCYSLVRAAMLLIERETTELDLNNAGHAAMMLALQQAEVLSQADVSSLYALASVPRLRYEELGVPEPHDGDITECRKRLELLPVE